MSDQNSMRKPKYETPPVVPLGELASASGACSAGSGDVTDCTAGALAKNACTAGPVNVGATCSAGGTANPTCTGGASPVA